MRKLILPAVLTGIVLLFSSCAGTVYTRAWAVNNADLTDSLTINGDSFTLLRTSGGGTTEFRGTFEDHGAQWVFNIESWKPANAAIKRFNPPVRYIYQVNKFADGVSFMKLVNVIGTSSFQFIQEGDFQRG
jgi:hypothetical protein